VKPQYFLTVFICTADKRLGHAHTLEVVTAVLDGEQLSLRVSDAIEIAVKIDIISSTTIAAAIPPTADIERARRDGLAHPASMSAVCSYRKVVPKRATGD
jgi:hypothetical protein